jgi:hypothetical protein
MRAWAYLSKDHERRTEETSFVIMHLDGFVILGIPLMGLAAICRGGKWHWNVVQQVAGEDIPWGKTLNALCWLGWFGALIVGTLRVCGVG